LGPAWLAESEFVSIFGGLDLVAKLSRRSLAQTAVPSCPSMA
jgi:hypothetical protein